jgi:FG-GAP-like repeat/Aldos-2-ulose dehydratase, beta-propeller domain
MRTLSFFAPVLFVSICLQAAPRFRAVEIDKIQIGYGVTVADVDGDTKPDILLVDKNQVAWYHNPDWKKHVIAENLTKLDHVCIAAADIDGDGKAEIAAGAGWNPGDTVNSGAVFYLVPPADRTAKWDPVELPHEPTVHRMRWVRGADGKYDLVVVPLHGRGNKNAQGEGVKVMAYKVPADPKSKSAWKTEVLNNSLHATHNFDPVQWDSDPAFEMLIGGREGSFLYDSKRTSGLVQLGGNESGGAGEIRLGKMKTGRRFFATVEPMHGTNLVVYLEPLGPQPKQWERHVLDSTLVDGHALACGDLTGQGSDQIVVGWRAMGKTDVKVGIKLFTMQADDPTKWTSTLVDDNQMACEDLCLADLNNDGKLDIIASGRGTKNVKIYFNESSP